MNRYFINGASCDEAIARAEYYRYNDYGPFNEGAAHDWTVCQTSEEARNNLLPSHIEIIQE